MQRNCNLEVAKICFLLSWCTLDIALPGIFQALAPQDRVNAITAFYRFSSVMDILMYRGYFFLSFQLGSFFCKFWNTRIPLDVLFRAAFDSGLMTEEVTLSK